MFRFGMRRFPFRLLGFAILALILMSLVGGGGGAAAGLGFALFLPFLIFKMFLMFMFFGFVMKMVGFAGPSRYGHPWAGGRRSEPAAPSKEDTEWREHVRRAREELDELFPDS